MISIPYIKKLLSRGENGQTLVEYGMIVSLLAMAAVFILGFVGQDVTSLFTMVSTKFQDINSP
jgi:Flp pilus assembly pilin Flp